MKKKLRALAFLLSAVMILSAASGCSQSDHQSENSVPSKSSQEGTAQSTASADGNVYPLKGNQTIKWWYTWSNTRYSNLGETPFGKELAKETGVNIEWIHPASGQESEQFNLMITSGDLPDIISGAFTDYANGGASRADTKGDHHQAE